MGGSPHAPTPLSQCGNGAARRQAGRAPSRAMLGVERSVGGEAVEKTGAAGAAQVVLAAAAVLAARGMRRIPRTRRGVVTQTLAVDVAEHRRALRAACPVLAGPVLVRRKSAAVHLRTRQDVMVVGRVADAGHDGAPLGERGRHPELVVVAVQIVDVLGDDLLLEILPGAAPDPIAGVDGLRATDRLGAEISAPRLAAGAGRLRQLLAAPVRALQSAEIRALAGPGAGYEKCHVGRLRRLLGLGAAAQSKG